MQKPDFNGFLKRASALIQADSRFAGLTVGGSWQDGNFDEWSDLDLVLVSYPDFQQALVSEAQSLASQMGDLLVGFTGEHIGHSNVLICLYDQPLLHVDLKFIPLPDFETRVENPLILFERKGELSEILSRTEGAYPMPDLQWIEDRFWVWIHYAALRLGRGELLELNDHLGYIRNTVLGSLQLMKYGFTPRRVRRAEQHLPPAALAELVSTIGRYERQALYQATLATVELYRKLRDYHATEHLQHQSRAENRALEFLKAVGEQGQ